MFVLSLSRRLRAGGVLLLLLLAGCGGGLTRSLAPDSDPHHSAATSEGAAIQRPDAPGVAAANLPPAATILDPVPTALLTPVLASPVTIGWSGQDTDGHLREYRYRVFESRNPDFPAVYDFVSFLQIHPDSVLNLYAPDFNGWERVRIRKGSTLASATYSNLVPFGTHAFVVVAVDNRGDHDPELTRNRNVLVFATGLGAQKLSAAAAR